MFVGVVMHLVSAHPLLSAYCRSVYRYKRMRLLTRVYGIVTLQLLYLFFYRVHANRVQAKNNYNFNLCAIFWYKIHYEKSWNTNFLALIRSCILLA